MQFMDLVKGFLVAVLFLILAPVGGLLLKGRRSWQRMAFALMCLLTMGGFFGPSEWGLTLGSIAEYKGHVKGFPFYYIESLALAMIIARALERNRDFRWVPPGLCLYLLYYVATLPSIFSASDVSLMLMALHKYFKFALILVAVFNFVRDEEDLRLFVKMIAWILIWEFLLALKLKYGNHIYRVAGTFEHPNCLVMYVNMAAMILLASSFSPKDRINTLTFFAFLGCAFIAVATVSRAGIVLLGAGSLVLALVITLRRPSVRRFAMLGFILLALAGGILKGIDTISERFVESSEPTTNLRGAMNEASRRMVRDHPLGVGWNNWALVVCRPYPYAEVFENWAAERGMKARENSTVGAVGLVESHYYLILSETGYHSLLAYLLFCGYYLWLNLRAFWFYRRHFLGYLSVGIAAGCWLNYCESFVEHVLVQPRNAFLWMMVLGITARIETWRRRQLVPASDPPRVRGHGRDTGEQPDGRRFEPPETPRRAQSALPQYGLLG